MIEKKKEDAVTHKEEEIPGHLLAIAKKHVRRACSEIRSMGFNPPCEDWEHDAKTALMEAQGSYDQKKGASIKTWVWKNVEYAMKNAKRKFLKENSSPDTLLWRRVRYLKSLFRLEAYKLPSENQLKEAGLTDPLATFFHEKTSEIRFRNKEVKSRNKKAEAIGMKPVEEEMRFGMAPAVEELGNGVTRHYFHRLRASDCYKIVKEVLMQSGNFHPASEAEAPLHSMALEDDELQDTVSFCRALQESSIQLAIVPTPDNLMESMIFINREEAEELYKLRKKMATMPAAAYLAKSEDITLDIAREFLDRWVPHRIQHCGFLPGGQSMIIDRSDSEDSGEGVPTIDVDTLGISEETRCGRFELGAQLRGILNDCLENLKPRDRALIIKHYVDKYTVKELARVYDEREQSLENWIKRSKAKLAKCLEAHLSDDGVLLQEADILLVDGYHDRLVHVSLYTDRVEVEQYIDVLPVMLDFNGRQFSPGSRANRSDKDCLCDVFNREVLPGKYKIEATIVLKPDSRELLVTVRSGRH